MKFTSKFFYVDRHRYFAIGIGGELWNECDDDCKVYWPVYHLKLLLGCWVWNMWWTSDKKKDYSNDK